MTIEVKGLHAQIGDKPILRGIDLKMGPGEIHAIMGPNGSGKSTLSNVIMGNPRYEVTAGQVLVDGEEILEMETYERARKGLFMAFQYPVEIPGITVGRFLKRAVEIKNKENPDFKASQFIKEMRAAMDYLEIDQKFINRYLNEGFSGGEKKRMEVLQMMLLKPAFGILDETDSGLDIDALKIVSKGINSLKGSDFSAMIITHYQRILNYIRPDYVHILYKGKIITSGGSDLVTTLEEKGYDWVKKEFGIEEEEHEQSPTVG